MAQNEKGQSSVAVAMVALNGPTPPTLRLADLGPVGTVECRDEMTSFELEGSSVAIRFVPAPIPWGDLEGPCRRALFWPDAGKSLQEHKAHLVVTVGNPQADAIDRALLLTRVIVSVLDEADATGVYWGAGGVIQPPKAFLKLASDAGRDMLPLHLWLSFAVGRTKRGGVAGYTIGLAAFGHMEIEVLESPLPAGELLDRLYTCAHYLLEKGPVLKDGDPIGMSPEDRIPVRLVPSTFGHKGLVIQLQFP